MRTSVRLRAAYSTTCQVTCGMAQAEAGGAEADPGDGREQAARLLGEEGRPEPCCPEKRPKAMPPTKAAMKPLPPSVRARRRPGARRPAGRSAATRCRSSRAGRRRGRAAPPKSPAARPAASPQPICSAALLTTAQVIPVVSSALARSSATRKKGTARPSLSPLSTSSACRTRAGTDGSVTTRWPRAASVEAQHGRQQEDGGERHAGEREHADAETGEHRQRQADEQQATRPAELVTQGAEIEARRVAEEQQHERHLGEALGHGALERDVDQPSTYAPATKPAPMKTIAEVIPRRSSGPRTRPTR